MAAEQKPSASDDPIVAEITRRLVTLYKPERVYLFGSAARGDDVSGSDYDFMVLVPEDTPKEARQTPELFEVLADIDAPIDVLVWPRDYFDERLHLPASFPATIVREGKLLYAA